MKSIFNLIISAFLLASNTILADDLSVGKMKSETCLGCHGVAGYNNVYPTYKVPKLAGQHADYIVSALKAYQNNDRSHPTMHANSMGLSERDMIDIAKYFESLK
tara:strand:- start:300 stop:611 length:312 start_codon:yes stop_codon:yes gene_type:complete